MDQPTNNEKLTAAAVNFSSIFFPYLGPILGIVLSGKSKFVKFHAYRCLIQELLATLVIGILMILSLSYSIYSVSRSMEGGFDWAKINWISLLVKSLVTWLLLALWGLVNAAISVKDALEALNGQIPSRASVSVRLASKLAHVQVRSLPNSSTK